MSSQIHPRAMIHPNAKIGADTVVEADVIIDEHVEIGANCHLRARAIVTGHTRLGDCNVVGYGAILGAEPQDTAYSGVISYVEIGHGNTFREYVTVHRGTAEHSKTIVGDRNLILTGAHVAHNCTLGNDITLVNNVLLAGHVVVQDHAFLGGDAVVHQHCRIGAYAMVRGQTRLGVDVPPFLMAVDTNEVIGINRVGLQRHGFTESRRRLIQRAFLVLYRRGLTRSEALGAIAADRELAPSEDIQQLCEFIRTSRRGICKLYRKHATLESSD
ncbi:MAG: acyl-ACP--UDP-N-acetylglucosamine O-acyltransferase [Oscillatoriales cyanobacterium SM2_2_1]|nr:acyl-ACP--UDP-N-acetylglucosamine O-acyltransferase [Oscillatoriales cyanobacterium SM2_2_1]